MTTTSPNFRWRMEAPGAVAQNNYPPTAAPRDLGTELTLALPGSPDAPPYDPEFVSLTERIASGIIGNSFTALSHREGNGAYAAVETDGDAEEAAWPLPPPADKPHPDAV
eukprot:CAMPEP_0194287168 /NCGR_PEP_ID=MMETSP0169-20130528/34131_1 /TAXON_ID=218684 /ORGANISM="Corethron pennatum, Strain L29A3" /LENGTH=109 /DNA_ID=CAMNT_0039033789 /DNA_START=6 /DNA_END=331 /DNA_ORIENTATION=-